MINERSDKFIGEWHEDKLHGIAKQEWDSGDSQWGQYKHGKREGYMILKDSDGRVNYYKCKNGFPNGYGI